MAVIGHADRVGLVAPRDSHQHRAEDLLARQPPIVGGVGEYGRDREIALAEWPFLGWQAAEHEARVLALQPVLDIAAHFGELLVVDDAADIGRLVERVAELQRLGLGAQLVEEAVEDVGVQEEARAGGAGLALPGEAHPGDDAVDHPILVGVGVDHRRALAAQFQ